MVPPSVRGPCRTRHPRGRADLPAAADRPVDLPRPCRRAARPGQALGAPQPRRCAVPRDRTRARRELRRPRGPQGLAAAAPRGRRDRPARTVERLMRAMGLRGAVRGRAVKTTVQNPALPCPLDRVNRHKAVSTGRRNAPMMEGAMTTRRRRSERRLRAALWSPGRPGVARREDRRRFWLAIAAGRSSEDAARDGGASQAVGSRWAQKAGGMPASHLAPSAPLSSGRPLSFVEREEIALLKAQGHGVREIARRAGRAPQAVSRELRRNAATRSGRLECRATTAQWHGPARGAAAEGREARDERRPALLRGGPPGGADRAARRHPPRRSPHYVEEASSRPPAGAPMGAGLEP